MMPCSTLHRPSQPKTTSTPIPPNSLPSSPTTRTNHLNSSPPQKTKHPKYLPQPHLAPEINPQTRQSLPPLEQEVRPTSPHVIPPTHYRRHNFGPIKHTCQERIRHFLYSATTQKQKARTNTNYDVNPKSHHRGLKIKKGPPPE
jgi:hypothetical protein